MLTRIQAGGYTLRGISLGGVYTTLRVDELDVLLDVGLAPRSFATTRAIFLSHGHADHIGALVACLGIRALHGIRKPPKLYMPEEIADTVEAQLACASTLQRFDLTVDAVPMAPGDAVHLRDNLWVRGFRTHHPVPALGYQFFRRVKKLRPAYLGCSGPEIKARKERGEDLFEDKELRELAYVTDTLLRVIDTAPGLLQSKVLILECTFLDARKSLEKCHKGCHIHLDEIIERADAFQNEQLVLMHFSQLYSPAEVHAILKKRLPKTLRNRVIAFAPKKGPWPG